MSDLHRVRVVTGPDNKVNRIVAEGVSAMETAAVLEGLPVDDLRVVVAVSHELGNDGGGDERQLAITGRGPDVDHASNEDDIAALLSYLLAATHYVGQQFGLTAAVVTADGTVINAHEIGEFGG